MKPKRRVSHVLYGPFQILSISPTQVALNIFRLKQFFFGDTWGVRNQKHTWPLSKSAEMHDTAKLFMSERAKWGSESGPVLTGWEVEIMSFI
jgi:hypothetical protein